MPRKLKGRFIYNDALQNGNIKAFTTVETDKDQFNDKGPILPLKHFEMSVDITCSVGEVTLFQTYQNATEKPLEILFHWPVQEDAAVTFLEIKIGEKVAIGKVQEKEKSKQKHEDALAKGNFSVYAARTESKDVLELSLGNLLPKEEVSLTLKYTKLAKCELGNFCFSIPTSYLPSQSNARNLASIEADKGASVYEVSLKVNLTTQDKLTYLHCPQGFQLEQSSINTASVMRKGSSTEIFGRNLDFYYCTSEISKPQLYY